MSSIQQFAVAAEAGPRALVVDDDVLAADALTSNLRSCGYQARFLMPVTESSLREALGWAPDLAVLDTDRLADEHVANLVTMLQECDVAVVLVAENPAAIAGVSGVPVVTKAALTTGPASAHRAIASHGHLADAGVPGPLPQWTHEVA